MKCIGAFAVLATVEAGTLAVTWEDCGAQHATVSDVSPASISTGKTETITGTGVVDEDVTSAHFTAVVKASGVKIASCEGDATADIDCKLPLGAGKITVKAVSYPIAKGTTEIPVEVTTSALIPASLAKVDTEIRATEQNGEDVICLNVHTAQQEELRAEGGTLAVTWDDCGAQHATVTDVSPASIQTGTTATITGTGTVDEDVTSAHFAATVKAAGVKIASCEGDATTDIECKLPLGAGKITVKAVNYPLAAGTVQIPVDVTTSSVIPASLAKVDAEIRATEQNGEDVICLNVHTAQQQELRAEGGTLAVTWDDCGAQHATVTDVQPASITTGTTATITGTGTVDEDVTAAHFSATVKAAGVKVASCEGDATTDIECKLPLGAGTITVKAVNYPLAAGTVSIPVEVTTSSVIPASLAKVDAEIRATEQNGEDVICLNVHTAKQEGIFV